MFNALIKAFVKNSDDVENPRVRTAYGNFVGFLGIILNTLMSLAKIVTGIISGAISILSDGINNLSDAGSSVITLFGFKLSNKKPDKEHPFGYGRMEYFAGLAVSLVIIVVAVQLLISSVKKIINGEILSFESNTVVVLTVVVLGVSVLIKLFMALLNRYVGKKINSVAISATSMDSLSDCISTTVVLICTLLSLYVDSFPIDGVAGVVVSLFIAYTGIRSVTETASLLLGSAPDSELVKKIADFATHYDERVVGVHDLMMHDYGPGRKIVVLHVEVPSEGNIMELHDVIDNIEVSLENKFNCLATIHLDPVDTTSKRVTELKNVCKNAVKELSPEFDIHDFRMNEGETHANLIFDLLVPYSCKMGKDEIVKNIAEKVKAYDEKLNVVIKVEHPLV